MVGTRRRSAVGGALKDVESPMLAENNTPTTSRRAKRVSEVSAEQSTLTTRVRSPRVSASAAKTALTPAKNTATPAKNTATPARKAKGSSPEPKPSAKKKSPENKHLAAALTEDVTKLAATRSPRVSRTASPRISASAKTTTPRTSRSSRSSKIESESTEPSSTETNNDQTETSSVDVTTELLTISNTRSRRLSSSSRPSTPTKSKLLSSADAQCLTPSRKSRRLSGCGPEEVADSVPLVLPPKKRRTSLLVEDDRNEEKIEKKEAEKSENIPEIVVAPPAAPTDNNLEMIQEIDEEAANTSIDKTESIEDKESDNGEKIESKVQSEISTENMEEDCITKKLDKLDAEAKIQETVDMEVSNVAKENKRPVDDEVTTKEIVKEPVVIEQAKDTETDKEKIKEDSDEEELLKKISLALINHIPRQKPKSGRFWKGERDQFRSIRKDRGNKKTFEERMKKKEEKERNKDLTKQIKEQKAAKIEALKQRQEENKKRREKNELKNEVYQVVKNPHKIKRMRKRDLAKRDILDKF